MHGKSLSGPTIDALSSTEASAIAGKKAIGYYREKGIAMLHDGWAASGRYLDLTLLADWLRARIDEALVQMVATYDTIPFNAVGESLVYRAIAGVLALAEQAGVIAPQGSDDGGWTVTVPKSSAISSVDRAGRRYPGARYSCRALGSMHTLDIAGSMGV